MTKKSKVKLPRRKYVLIALIILLIAALSLGVWIFLQNKKTHESTHPADVVHAADVSTVITDSRQYINRNDVKSGAAYYDDKITSAEDSAIRKQLLIAKVDYLLLAQDNSGAVKVAEDVASEYKDDAEVYAALARAYETNGQKKEALAAYKQALAALKGDQPPSRANPRVIYETKIKEIESQ